MSSLGISNITNARNMVAQNQLKGKSNSTRKFDEKYLWDQHAKSCGKVAGTAAAISGFGAGLGITAMKLQHVKWDYKLGKQTDKFAKAIAESTLLRRATAILGGLGAAGLLGWGLYKITSNIISNQMD